MVCFYSIYLLIMYFNPRIEAWLYKVTKTKSPEYKSELHASNGKGQAYSQLPEDEAQEQDQGKDEKNDVEKETPDKENESEDKPKEDKDESKDVKGYSGKFLSAERCQVSKFAFSLSTTSQWRIQERGPGAQSTYF